MPFSAILPRVKTLRVRVAVTVTCVSFWLFAGAIFYHGATAVGLIVAAAFAVTAIYLWRLRAWARKVATFSIATSILLFMCGGIFNPFFLMDYHAAHGLEFDLFRWSLISLPSVTVAIWCYWVLSRNKGEFRQTKSNQTLQATAGNSNE